MPIGGSSGGLSSAGPGAGGGAQGPQGATGSQGAQGHQGTQGNQGTQGSAGAQGTQGTQGGTGAQGPQGATGGGGAAGAAIVRKFAFAYNTPGILTGAALYTPTVGDILLDAWIEIDTAWDGTTPQGDFGPFVNNSGGLLSNGPDFPGVCDMTQVDAAALDAGLLSGATGSSGGGVRGPDFVQNTIYSLISVSLVSGNQNAPGARLMPLKWTVAHPIKVVVSQDGTNTGADPGSTQGAAVLYLVTSTPV